MGPQRMYGLTPWVRRLLVANLLVFLVQSTLLTSPSFAGAFGFSPARAWQYPWTFVTYMFLHAGIPHILFNMLVLFVFGSSVEDRMGGRLFLLFYLLCGIGGAASSFILRQRVPVSQIIGASGAVLGAADEVSREERARRAGERRDRSRARQDHRERRREPHTRRAQVSHRDQPPVAHTPKVLGGELSTRAW